MGALAMPLEHPQFGGGAPRLGRLSAVRVPLGTLSQSMVQFEGPTMGLGRIGR